MKYEIKLSEVIEIINRGMDVYICHAIRSKAREGITDRTVWVSASSVFTAMNNLMPEVFCRRQYHVYTVVDWMNVNKVPNHLRLTAQKNMPVSEYRIKLLQWMISKIGDQTLSVEVI